jgi:hypothetical protein
MAFFFIFAEHGGSLPGGRGECGANVGGSTVLGSGSIALSIVPGNMPKGLGVLFESSCLECGSRVGAAPRRTISVTLI